MKEIKLFDYQEDMKERIEKALRLHRSVMAQMPTGTGKTVLLASVVESFLREHSNCHVWIVAHRRELVSQIRETIERVFSKITPQWSLHPIQWLSNSYKHDEYYPVDNLCPVQAWLSEHPKGRRLVLCEPLVIKTHNRSRWLFLLLLF